MRIKLWPIAAAIVVLAMSSKGPVLIAGPGDDLPAPGEQPGVIDTRRPFLEAIPDWNDGLAFARKVVDDDGEAVKKFESSGLTWARHVHVIDRSNEHLIAARLRHMDWLRDMQRWENVLIAGHPTEVEVAYAELADRFRHKEAQLARAILYVWRWGDTDAQKRLQKLAADSKWVKAAVGFIGKDLPLKECVEAMRAVLPEVDELVRLREYYYFSQLRPAGQRRSHSDPMARRQDLENFMSTDGISELPMCPPEWAEGLIYERIGALVNEVGDADYTRKIETEIRSHVTATDQTGAHFLVFSLAAWVGNSPFDKVAPQDFARIAEYSLGMNTAVYALHYCPAWMWFETCQASALAFHGMPDITLCRRLCLSRYLAQGDPMLARLACRAVIAMDDDQASTYNDIARALVRFGSEPELERQFAKALAQTKHKKLNEISGALAGRDTAKLETVPRVALNLKLADKAALLAVFCHKEELDVHGGETAVYWLNRAVFHEAGRNIRAAADAHFEAVKAQEGAEGREGMTPNILQCLLFAERNFTPAAWKREVETLKKTRAKIAERLTEVEEKLYDRDAGPEFNALPMAFSAHAVHAEVSEEAQDQLANHPQRWGGTGLVIASITEFRAHNFTRRKQLYEAAARTSPLCLYVHYKMTNDGENFGTLQAANWDIAARHSCALTLVQPYSLNALTASANVHLRNGEFGTSLCGISLGMMTRPVRRFTGGRTMDQVQAITVGRGSHARALARMVLADPDAVKTRQQVAFDNLYELQNRYRGQNWAGLAGFGGPVSFYRTQVVEREIRGMDMNDVNNLLNFSYSTAGYWPEQAIGWAELADTIGVSNYGRFVGTQALLSAHAKLGQFEKVEERYHEMRGGRSGRPPFLDVFLLAGLTQGNNHAQVHKVIEAVEKHDTDEHADNNYFHFLWRRTLMMAGRHADVAEAPAPESQPFQLEDANAFSLLFHEARHRFESGEFKTIRDRTDPYLEFKVEAGMGVYLDAALLKALAIKLEGGDLGHDPKKQTLKVVEPEFVDVFLDSPRMIDCQVFDMLCGRRKLEAPSGGPGLLWHGATYGERTPAHMGSGIATITEMSARASFIVGVLAFLADDNKGAKAAFSVCVEFNQRNSHEYHVAEWLLAKHLKE